MVRAFSPEYYFANFLGRCPRLIWDGPLVLSRINPNRIGGDACALWSPLTVPWAINLWVSVARKRLAKGADGG